MAMPAGAVVWIPTRSPWGAVVIGPPPVFPAKKLKPSCAGPPGGAGRHGGVTKIPAPPPLTLKMLHPLAVLLAPRLTLTCNRARCRRPDHADEATAAATPIRAFLSIVPHGS